MKVCVRCLQSKPLDAFYKRASAKDGRASYCKDCQRAYLRGWKNENRDRVHELNKQYYERNRDAKLAYGAAWRARNKERHAEMIRAWERANPDKVAAKYKRYRERHPEKFKAWQDARRDSGRRRLSNLVRRALIAQATVPGFELTADVLYGRFELHGWKCYYCGKPLTMKTVEAEHRIPVSRGGRNCGANIVPACRTCNVTKSDRTEAEFKAVLRGKHG